MRLSLVVLAPLLFCGLLEVGLRVAGYGYPTGFFVGPDAAGTYTTNHRFGWRFFPRRLAREPHPALLAAKPTATIRIFVIGSSAAAGFPDPSYGVGPILEVLLREQYPGVRFEVVNGAMTAINSHVTLEIARDCAVHEPDLFVVHMGNNEVTGPFGPGTVFQRWSPSLGMVRANLWVKSTRVGQLLGDLATGVVGNEGTPASWRGLEMFLDNPVAADDARLTAVYENYRRNLTDVCGVARRVQAPVILSTVAVNLRDCPPLASLHRPDLSPEELASWNAFYKAGGEWEAQRCWQAALEQYEAAAQIDDRFAELQFRCGQCLLQSGRWQESQPRFESARDLDALRCRADSRINAIIREVAAAHASDGVRLVDAERALAGNAAGSERILGEEVFYEHVHMNFTGNYLLARAILEQVCQAVPALASLPRQGELPSKQRCAELLALTPWDEYRVADLLANMTARKPFSNQLDHHRRHAQARQRRDDLRRVAAMPEAMQKTWKTYESALARNPDNPNLQHRFGMLALHWEQPDVAVQHLREAARMLPGNATLQTDLGDALAASGRLDEAFVRFQMVLELKPDSEHPYNNLGNILAARRRWPEAIAHFQKALEINPEFVESHNNLGLALARCGKLPEAIAHFQKALDIKPDYVEARRNLDSALASHGKVVNASAEVPVSAKPGSNP